MRRSARILAFALVAMLTLATAACTSDSPSSTTSSNGDLPVKNLETWALPLDQFANTTMALRSYVEKLMAADCMAQQGVALPDPWQPIDRPALSPSFTPGGIRIFNEAIAAEYGYHLIPLSYEGVEAWKQAVIDTDALFAKHPEFDPLFTSCLEDARGEIPPTPPEDANVAFSVASDIYERSEQDAAVKKATQTWRECMIDAGLGGFADTPVRMPGEQKFAEWPASEIGPISAEEIRVATADAECRTTSGWSQAFYDAQYELQSEYVRKNADRLARIAEELKKEREQLLAAAARYAPK